MKSRLFVQFLPLALVAFGAFGCNETSQPEAQQAVTVPCRCSAPVAAATVAAVNAPSVRHFGHHHVHRWASTRESHWSETWSESEHSSSTVDYGYDESSPRESRVEAEASAARYEYWVDAYGRRHCYDRVQRREVAWRGGADEGTRLDPWHGYDGNDGPENGY